MTDTPFTDAELVEYRAAAADAASRLLEKVNGPHPWALARLLPDEKPSVVVIVARDGAADVFAAMATKEDEG